MIGVMMSEEERKKAALKLKKEVGNAIDRFEEACPEFSVASIHVDRSRGVYLAFHMERRRGRQVSDEK